MTLMDLPVDIDDGFQHPIYLTLPEIRALVAAIEDSPWPDVEQLTLRDRLAAYLQTQIKEPHNG